MRSFNTFSSCLAAATYFARIQYVQAIDPFYVNCVEQNITSAKSCELHIRNTLVDYVNKGGYSRDSLPVANDDEMPFKAYTWMTFNSINDVSVIEGKMTVAIFLDIVWFDPFLTWNSSLTLGVSNLYIDPKLVYKPDFILYNAVGSYDDMLSSQVIEWYADGGMWNSRQGQITFSCEFDLMDFPADVQTCTAKFASFVYPAQYLKFLAPLPFLEDDIPFDLDTTIVLPTFQSSEWKVSDLRSREYDEELYGGEYSFMSWTITLNRYPQFYMATAVYPETIVCVIAILGFWVTDIPSRLSLSMTALLTILAAQWSVSDTLPVSREFTWLSKYSVICIVLIAFCVAQACVVAFMRKHSHVVPPWVHAVISLSRTGHAIYHHIMCPFVAGAKEVRRLSNIVLPPSETMLELAEMQKSEKRSLVQNRDNRQIAPDNYASAENGSSADTKQAEASRSKQLYECTSKGQRIL